MRSASLLPPIRTVGGVQHARASRNRLLRAASPCKRTFLKPSKQIVAGLEPVEGDSSFAAEPASVGNRIAGGLERR